MGCFWDRRDLNSRGVPVYSRVCCYVCLRARIGVRMCSMYTRRSVCVCVHMVVQSFDYDCSHQILSLIIHFSLYNCRSLRYHIIRCTNKLYTIYTRLHTYIVRRNRYTTIHASNSELHVSALQQTPYIRLRHYSLYMVHRTSHLIRHVTFIIYNSL